MKTIHIGNGRYAIIDDTDYEFVSQFKWWGTTNRQGRIYARTKRDGKPVNMHRLVIGLTDPRQHCDHVNRNTLDNRRQNLRVANNSLNHANQSKTRKNTSGFKGVIKRDCNKTNPWAANICVNYRTIHIGYFATPEAAAKAYDQAARKHFGEFACTNFP